MTVEKALAELDEAKERLEVAEEHLDGAVREADRDPASALELVRLAREDAQDLIEALDRARKELDP